MARPQFVPAPGFDEELARMPGLIKERKRVAEAIVDAAKDAAPRGSDHYYDSLRAVVDGDEVRAESDDPAAHLVEFGSINNEAYAPLRRGAASVGRLVEDRKP